MLPPVLRALPWIVTSCLVCGCESEQSATSADASGKAGADAKAGVDAKTVADEKKGTDTKTVADAKTGSNTKTATDTKAKTTPKPTPTPAKPADALRGGAPLDLSPEADFAQIQYPQLSLDGRHVTYNDETKVMIRSLDPDDTRAS